MKYFIYWKSLSTGYIGHGGCFDIDDIYKYVSRLDKSLKGEIVHYYLKWEYYNTFIDNIHDWPIGL